MQKRPISISAGRPDGKTRQDQSPSALIYQFDPYMLDLSRYELRRNETRLRLARAPMDLLILLIQKRNILLSREEIAARLWPNPEMVDTEQGINTAIRRIREVLSDDPAKPRFVETVVGKGYRFIANVKESRSDSTLVGMPSRQNIQAGPELLRESPNASEPLEVPKPELLKAPELPDPFEQAPPPNPDPPRDSNARATRFIIQVATILSLLILTIACLTWWWFHRQQAVNPTASLVQITTNDSELRVTAAAISPDGRWIVYADISGISLRTIRSGETVALKGPDDLRIERIAWFPDQTKVLVSGFDSKIASSEIWTIFIAGDAPPAAIPERCPQWDTFSGWHKDSLLGR